MSDRERPKFIVVESWPWPQGFVGSETRRILEPAGDVVMFEVGSGLSAFGAVAADADAIVVAPWQGVGELGPACWDLAPSLRVVAGTFDNRIEVGLGAPLASFAARGTRVVDTSRTMTPSVAEFSLAMMLNLLRDIPDAVATVRRGGWWTAYEDTRPGVNLDLTGARVGLAGFGVINRRLTELLAPFRCDLGAYDPFVSDDVLAAAGVTRYASLVELAARSDLFVVGIPPTPATQQIIDRAVIEALPVGAGFVLPTRMAVVEQEALWTRAARGEIRAAVDVFDPEPPPDDAALRTDPNVLPTPHIAGNTLVCHRRCFTVACTEAIAALKGEQLHYEMTPHDEDLYAGRVDRVQTREG
jgi:phosphoglycerate dehydrogenase-like enzyme